MSRLKHVNSIVDRDFRNRINQVIDVVNSVGISIDELVVKGVMTTDQYSNLLTAINGLVKTGEVGVESLNKDLKLKLSEIDNKIQHGSLSVYDINKNLGKIDQTFLTDELLQQIAGTTPINVIPADKSITYEKIAFDYLTMNKGKVYPMEKIGADDKTGVLNGVLDVLVQNAKINTKYALTFIGKDTTSWETTPQTFIEIISTTDNFITYKNLIGRFNVAEQNISNGQSGVRSHVITVPGVDEIFTVSLDWSALSANNNFRSGTSINYIISPNRYFFKRTSNNTSSKLLEDEIAFNLEGRYVSAKHTIGDSSNIIYEFGKLTPNDYFEVIGVKKQDKSADLNDYTGDPIISSSTDWVSPYGMLAKENITSTGKFSVGGGHGTNGGTGFATGRFIGLFDVKLDGKTVEDGNYKGKSLKFRVEHYVSASNVINLETGEKRDTAKEIRYYTIDKSGIHVEVKVIALEPLIITNYAGLQTVQRDTFDYFYFRNDVPNKLYKINSLTGFELPTITNPQILDRVVMYNQDIVMIMHTDRTYGVGTGEFIPNTAPNRPMHATPTKIYMHNLGRSGNNYEMNTNDEIKYRGSWIFTRNLSTTDNMVEYKFKEITYTDDISSYEIIVGGV